MQTLPTQVSPWGHWMHAAVQRSPALLSDAQVLSEHRWNPLSHAGTHAVPSQVTVPFAGAAQVVQVGPHASTVLLATQVGD